MADTAREKAVAALAEALKAAAPRMAPEYPVDDFVLSIRAGQDAEWTVAALDANPAAKAALRDWLGPFPEDFDRMTPEQFDRFVERIGFGDRIRAALTEPMGDATLAVAAAEDQRYEQFVRVMETAEPDDPSEEPADD